jgi:hypothetical protein
MMYSIDSKRYVSFYDVKGTEIKITFSAIKKIAREVSAL